MNKRRSPINTYINKFWEWISIPKFILIVVVIAAIFVAAINFIFRPKPDVFESASLDTIQDRAVFRFAVHGEVPGFSFKEEQEDEEEVWSGLEVDIGKEIARMILDDSQSVEILEAGYPLRNYFLDMDIADCIIGISPNGYSPNQIYSMPYYVDEVVVIVPLEGFSTLRAMHGSPGGSRTRIGVITRATASAATTNPIAHEGAHTVLQQYNQTNGTDFNIISYSSAPDMFDDLRRGKLDAIAIEEVFVANYIDGETMRLLVDRLGTVEYSIAAMPENTALIEIANIAISNMINSGEMQRLFSEYELSGIW